MPVSIKFFFKFIVSLIFPSYCVGCRKSGYILCSDCLNKLEILRHDREIKGINIKKIYIPFSYKNNLLIKKIISDIKYKFHFSSIDIISNFFVDIIKRNFSSKQIILVPVPLFYARKLWRGFNQSEKISESILNQLGKDIITICHLLKRNKNTQIQSYLGKHERFDNVKGSFVTNEKALKFYKEININSDKVTILIDDVFTTGATIEACALEIKKYNNFDIYGIVIASDFLYKSK